mgnify:CR=1 FL=1
MSRGWDAHNAIDELEGEIESLENEIEELKHELGEIEDIGHSSRSLRDMIENLYIAKTTASEREFEYQLREVFLKVLNKRL